MSIKEQTDKELADAGRMLAAQLSEISVELGRRGVDVNVSGYYHTPIGGQQSIRWQFEAKRVSEERL